MSDLVIAYQKITELNRAVTTLEERVTALELDLCRQATERYHAEQEKKARNTK